MTYQERRAALARNRNAKIVWIMTLVLFGLSGLGALMAAIVLIFFTGLAADSSIGGAFVLGLGTIVILPFLILSALFLFGIWRLSSWVMWLIWIGVALDVPTIFFSMRGSMRGMLSGLLSILVALGYTYVVQQVKKTSIEPMAPTQIGT